MGFSLSIVILIQHDPQRSIVAEWGKEAPLTAKPWSDIIDMKAYAKWRKKNPIDPDITDLSKAVVYIGFKGEFA